MISTVFSCHIHHLKGMAPFAMLANLFGLWRSGQVKTGTEVTTNRSYFIVVTLINNFLMRGRNWMVRQTGHMQFDLSGFVVVLSVSAHWNYMRSFEEALMPEITPPLMILIWLIRGVTRYWKNLKLPMWFWCVDKVENHFMRSFHWPLCWVNAGVTCWQNSQPSIIM